MSNLNIYGNSCSELKYFSDVQLNEKYFNYDKYGNPNGYQWEHKETLTLKFDFHPYYLVENNSIIYTEPSQQPTVNTQGFIGQKAYNSVDLTTWMCVDILVDQFIWTEFPTFTLPNVGTNINYTKKMYVENYPDQLIQDVTRVKFQIFTFRFQKLYEKQITYNGNQLQLYIDNDLSDKMVEGNYFLQICFVNTLLDYDENHEVKNHQVRKYLNMFDSQICPITIK